MKYAKLQVSKLTIPPLPKSNNNYYLCDLGYESRHIMLMSNHKSGSSLKSYNRSMPSNQKKTISSTLSTMATGRKHVESTSTLSTIDVSTLCTLSETGVSTVTNRISSTTSIQTKTKQITKSDSELLDRSSTTVRFASTEEWPPRDRITASTEFNDAVLFTTYSSCFHFSSL